MLEDDQRFEELESKLAALSSQVESLELDTEVDPFFEDDVRRVIDDFKSRELAGLESEAEDFEDDESSSSDDFISVQTTGGPSFKTHWIAPESCENMTRDLARDAFVQGAADRYGTSQQVNNGDVLILLCREAAGEEPEEGSEPADPEAPKKICRYIGLAYNTLVHPASAEPTSTTEESISAPVGNYEIFVWSSCECSGEPAETVVLPSIFEASSESSTNGNYASIGDDASPDMSNADGLLTEASLRKSQDTSSSNLAKGLSNTLTKNDAGYKAQLVQLSQELSRYHLDQKKNQLNFKADKKNLNTHGFGSDLFVSKNLTLSNGECGNLETVSISGETFDLALLKEGDGTHDSTFLTTAKISLGTAVSIGGTFNLDVYDTNADDLDTSLELTQGSTVFLPVITETAADEIANTDTLNTSTISLNTPVVTGDGENFTVSIGTQITTLTANYSSGLLTHKDSPVTAAGPTITFSIPDREVSLANLTSLGNSGPAGHYLKELSTIRATGEYDQFGSLDLQVEFDALRSQLNFTEHGLFLNETSPESVTLSVGNISISPYTIDTFPDLGEERSDALISNISSLSSSIDSSHSNSGETKIDLTGSLQNTNYTFNKGLLTGVSISNTPGVSLGSIIVPKPAEISLADLTSLGNSGPAGHYLKELSTIRATGEYDESGSLDLQVEFDALRSQLNFTDHGLYDSETAPESITQTLGTISIAPMSIGTFPSLGAETTDNLLTQISGISSTEDTSHTVSGEKKLLLSGALNGKQYTFNKGILTQVGSFNSQDVSLGSIIVPSGGTSTDGTNTNHAPNLFKTSVNSQSSSSFYQKSVSIFSSSEELINFVDGVAMSIHNPKYSLVSSLNLDASNNNGAATVTKLTDISVRGVYDVINESEGTGDARYYIDYTYKDISLTIRNGLVTVLNTGQTTVFSEGPIIVPGTEIRYGCHPDYGCQLDAAGEYTEPSCGGGCTAEELILSYRPAKIWIYEPSSFDDGEFCYEFVSEHEITEPAAPAENNLANQYYTNGGHFKAESDGVGGQVDNFYVNGSLIPKEKVFFAEKDYSEKCYEHKYTMPYVHIAQYVNDSSNRNGTCLRHLSTHELIPAQSNDRVLVYTDGVEMLSFPNLPQSHIVSRWYLNNKLLSPNEYSIVNSVQPTPVYGDLCDEAKDIDYFASGDSTAFTDTINFAETESDTQVSVSVTYEDINNSGGSSTRFYDSSGAELPPIESYIYSEGNDPLRWTLSIPAGSTSVEIEQNSTGSNWTLEMYSI